MIAACARSSTTVTTRSGSEAAAAKPSCGGNWKRLQILVVIVSMPAGRAWIAGAPQSVLDARQGVRKAPRSAAATRVFGVLRPAAHAGAPRLRQGAPRSPRHAPRAV